MSTPFPKHTPVHFDNGVANGYGRIVGISTVEMPVVGMTYIVEVSKSQGIDPQEYDYPCIVVSACHLTPIPDSDAENQKPS